MKQLKNEAESRQSCVSVSVTDLRIGNLLMELTSDDVFLVTDRYFSMIDINIECCRPIPLTEYWIKKLGFFCYGKKRNWFDIDISKGYEMSINTDGKISIGQNGNWTSLNFINKIEYVHQLQNIYHALTGSELQIGNLTEH